MLQVNQTYIIAGSGETYQKLIKRPFIKYIELHLRARDKPPSVTLKIIHQIKQWTETRAIGALTI